mgnify:FL=1
MKKIYESDPWLEPWKDAIEKRHRHILDVWSRHSEANSHLYYGLHKTEDGWVIREWAPNANMIYLIGECNNWKRVRSYAFSPIGNGNWELKLPDFFLHHGELYKLWIEWSGGGAERLPAYVTRAVQDPYTKVFSAQVWDPPVSYIWKNEFKRSQEAPFIYECHIGMCSEEEKVASFDDFRTIVLPRVKRLGYNTIQIMALQEHPYYGSFGYQVSNFFALSSRFGTPEEFKHLVDEAHAMGIAVIMDIVHSHSVSNEAEGLSRFDGRDDLYFYKGAAGYHPAWGSRCFDYGKDEVINFLLSNCKYWLEEYHLDGFRFDGVTSMMYWDHGLGTDFGNYELYFNSGVDENAVAYLGCANILIHKLRPDAITIAEDVSGMAGLAAPLDCDGVGFDYRMAMGVADHWIKWIKERSDQQWSMGEMWWELTRKREDEKTISYAECHDQAMVGDKTIAFRLMDKEMYYSMNKSSTNLIIDRGIALHKMIRLLTAATAGNGYLTFMGNEFGHPEWIDFPREGNGWSFKYARRQWSLADNPLLRYGGLEAFDGEFVKFFRKYKILEAPPELLRSDEEKKVLILRRQNVIFAFNFSPSESYENYAFETSDGEYQMQFDSDAAEFGGFGRLQAGERHITINHMLRLYLPCRCAEVLIKL